MRPNSFQASTTSSNPTFAGEGRTTLIHLDHMNDYRGYTKTLSKWTKQLRLGGVLFLSLHCKPRPRHIFAIIDSPTVLGGTGEFLERLRTQNVDVNMRGKPCKERMSKVVAEFPLLLPSRSPSGQNNHNEKGWKMDQQQTNNGGSGSSMMALEDFQVVETEGMNGSQTHMPFVRNWLSDHYRPDDAKTIIAAMDDFLDSTTKPNKRR